nr:unnamed protein product [Digitaria exilis]
MQGLATPRIDLAPSVAHRRGPASLSSSAEPARTSLEAPPRACRSLRRTSSPTSMTTTSSSSSRLLSPAWSFFAGTDERRRLGEATA